jgi:hypothetical protein
VEVRFVHVDHVLVDVVEDVEDCVERRPPTWIAFPAGFLKETKI